MNAALPKQKKLVSISQAAKLLGVSIDTVRRWNNSGVLHSERPDGKNRYFSLIELEKHKNGQPLPISEASKKLRISPTTLRRLETRGLLVPKRNKAGERVYGKDSLKNFLNSDYFLRKKPIKEKISEPIQEVKDFSEDRLTLKKTQDTESITPAADSNPPTPNKSSEEIFSNSKHMSSHRMLEVITAVVIFALLSAIGATNITLSEIKSLQSSQIPAVLSETVTHEEPAEASISTELTTEIETSEAEPTAEPVTLESIQSLLEEAADYDPNEATKAAEEKEEESGSPDLADFKIILSVKTGGADFINIREKPSTESGKINEAKDGDTFEMVSRDSDWYQIKLNNGSNGFISEEFAEIREIN